MVTKKKNPLKNKPARTGGPELAHSLDALLRTVRSIAHYEDALCELTQEARRSGELTSDSRSELVKILEQIPSHELLVDLESAEGLLRRKSPKRALAKPAPSGRKKTTTPKSAAKTSRRRVSK